MRFPCLLMIGLMSVASAFADPVRILCIGDSITQGRGDHSKAGKERIPTAGWRWSFWTKLVDADIDHQFVGTMTDGFETTPDYPGYKGHTFQNLHEARWGWTTEGVAKKLAELPNRPVADVALIYLGTNREKLTDEEKASDPTGVVRTTAAMRSLLTLLRADNPHVILAVRLQVGDDARAKGLSSSFESLVAEFNRPDAPAVAVPAPADWQWDPKAEPTDTVDGCHPNATGDEKIARSFYDAVMPLLKKSR